MALSIAAFYLSYLFCFSLTILEYVEFRWLMLFPFMLSVVCVIEFWNKYKDVRLFDIALNLNFIVMALLTIFKIGVW